MRHRVAAVVATTVVAVAPLVAIALLVAACGSTALPSTVPSASSAPSAAASNTVAVDESLMARLPVAVGGIVLTADPATAADIATDPSLAGSASAIAVAFAIVPGPSSGADQVAVASVVKLRDGVFGDAFYRSWRDSYDTAACQSAGGVSGHAEADIGSRHAYIGTCSGGAHTYHVYLEGKGIIVSVTSVGDQRLGEQIVAGLRD